MEITEKKERLQEYQKGKDPYKMQAEKCLEEAEERKTACGMPDAEEVSNNLLVSV